MGRNVHKVRGMAQQQHQMMWGGCLTEAPSVQLPKQIQQGSLMLFQQQEPYFWALDSNPVLELHLSSLENGIEFTKNEKNYEKILNDIETEIWTPL